MKFNQIKYKFSATILAVALITALPLSVYILYKMEQEIIENVILNGKGNAKLMARTMLDVFLRSSGNPESTKIDAIEAISTYKDQVEVGLVYAQSILLTPRHRGKILATLDTQKKDIIDKQAALKSDADIRTIEKYAEQHVGPCPNMPQQACFNFSHTGIFDKTPVVLTLLSVSQDHVLSPVRKMRLLVIVVAIGATFGAIFLGVFVSRFITTPIAMLVEGVRKYSQGELSHKVDLQVRDELKTLAEAFNDMAQEIAQRIREIEEHRDTLEIKVKERTADLSRALQDVTALKEQQDADYYLTSHLIVPLCINRNDSDRIMTEFYIQQKKTFVFRNKQGSIGGDICITANLRFRENGRVNRYVFATNADAMGKSIQGGGGAIVFGTAINTILASSTANNRVLETSPHEWLQRVHDELHNIFLSFQGSMMISAVVMLLNEHNGKVYFFNAEHPWTILFRDGKADFIENDISYRKLGADMDMDTGRIAEFTAKEGDILILGSDGRDDIEIFVSQDRQERIINEDERAFLQHVNAAQGSLPEIVASLKKAGNFIDDLSILQIKIVKFRDYDESAENVPAERPTNAYAQLAQVSRLLREKKLAEAEKALREVASTSDAARYAEYHYLYGKIQLQQGDKQAARAALEKAIAMGMESAAVYKTLGHICYLLKDHPAAVAAWEKAAFLNPDDIRLKGTLEEVRARVTGKRAES